MCNAILAAILYDRNGGQGAKEAGACCSDRLGMAGWPAWAMAGEKGGKSTMSGSHISTTDNVGGANVLLSRDVVGMHGVLKSKGNIAGETNGCEVDAERVLHAAIRNHSGGFTGLFMAYCRVGSAAGLAISRR